MLLFWAMPAATLFSALTLTSVPLLPATPAMVFAATITAQVAVLSPQVAVIVAVPALSGVTTPSSTVAIDESLEVQLTVVSSASAGLTVAESFVEASPTVKDRLVLLSSTFWAGLVTVTETVWESDPAVMTKEPEPVLRAVTV